MTEANVVTQQVPMTITLDQTKTEKRALFKSSAPYCFYIFRDGARANFINHRFTTNIIGQIKELEELAALPNQGIYVDPDERIVEENLDPMAGLREQIIADYLAKQKAAIDPTNDMGSSDQGKLRMASSTDIAEAAAGVTKSGTFAPKIAVKN